MCPDLQHHAKKIHIDSLDILNNYAYTVALPAPSLYAQFNNLDDVNILLTASSTSVLMMSMKSVPQQKLVSEASRKYVDEHKDQWPFISTACPSVVRLIRVRFPNLIDHLLPILPPIEVAATLARKRAMAKTGLPADKIGIILFHHVHPRSPMSNPHLEQPAVK